MSLWPDLIWPRTTEPLRYIFNEPSTWIGLANAGYTTIVGLAVNQRRVDVCNKVCINTIYTRNPNSMILGLGHCKCANLQCNQKLKSMISWPRPLWPATDSIVINAINFNPSIYWPCFGMSSLDFFLHFQVNEILNVADLATRTVSGTDTATLVTSTQTAVTAIVNKINEILAKSTLTCDWYG